jgi:hypothetical protein
VRQHVDHKRSFFLLEQLILKHSAHVNTVSVKNAPDGEFLISHSPPPRALVSRDSHSRSNQCSSGPFNGGESSETSGGYWLCLVLAVASAGDIPVSAWTVVGAERK